MPEPTSEAGAVLLNERIYIIGGLDANEEVTDEVKVYDIQSNSWSAATPLPIPLDHSGVAVHDGRIYLVGGFLEKKFQLISCLFMILKVINGRKENRYQSREGH
jgi:N-acetylneuraminic acid mutarotase